MKLAANFVNSILAGALIAIGGAVFLSCESKPLGALFFSLGLLTIVTRGFYLFTGKAGYAVEQKPAYLGFLSLVWLGNFAGTGLVALALRATRAGEAMAQKADALWQVKTADTLTSLLVLSVFCGVLMYLAVDAYKTLQNDTARVVLVIFCVVVFILCGFEHCVANMFYGWVALAWNPNTLCRLLLMSAGNLLGGILVPLSKKLTAAHCT